MFEYCVAHPLHRVHMHLQRKRLHAIARPPHAGCTQQVTPRRPAPATPRRPAPATPRLRQSHRQPLMRSNTGTVTIPFTKLMRSFAPQEWCDGDAAAPS